MTKKRWITAGVLAGVAVVASTSLVLIQSGSAQGSGPIPLIVVPPCCSDVLPDTNVAPNPGLYFSSSTNGVWVAGQDPTTDSIGITGGGFSTPGDAIDYTTNGGSSWSDGLDDVNGIFGVDFVNANDGWAPADDGLYQTTNGGSSWTPVDVALSNPLAEVEFTSTTSGLGVDTQGEVWTTSDGGADWTPYSNLTAPVASLCLSSSEYYAADLNGNVWTSTNSGSTWTNVYTFEGANSGDQAPATTECDGENANVNFSSQSATPGGVQFEDLDTQNGGSSWSVIENTVTGISDATSSTLDAASGPAYMQPDTNGTLIDATYQIGQGAISVNTYSGNPLGSSNQTPIALTSTNITNAEIVDGNPWATSPIYSLWFANANDGWFAASLSSDSDGTFASVIYATTNGGATWSPVFSTPVYDFFGGD